jgi:hypothetical protein
VLGITLLVNVNAVSALGQLLKPSDGDTVFIIKSFEVPATVIPLKQVDPGVGMMMRMPNLDQSSLGSLRVDQTEDKAQSERLSHGDHRKKKIVKTKSNRPASLKFSKAKVNGALRMPRVQFSRVRPAVDIREELPDIDFNSKTLRESGF